MTGLKKYFLIILIFLGSFLSFVMFVNSAEAIHQWSCSTVFYDDATHNSCTVPADSSTSGCFLSDQSASCAHNEIDGYEETFCSRSSICGHPTPTPTPTPDPACNICGTCISELANPWKRQCNSLEVGDFCDSAGCSAPPTPTPGPTSTPAPTPSPTPTGLPTPTPTSFIPKPTPFPLTPTPTLDPTVFNITVTINNSFPARGEPVIVTANPSGTFSSPVAFDLDCNSDGNLEYSQQGTTESFPFTIPKPCHYLQSGRQTITVKATDDSFNETERKAHVTVLLRYSCDKVTFTGSTDCTGPNSFDTYCWDNDDTTRKPNCVVQGSGSYYISCTDCDGLGGCSDAPGTCNLVPTPTTPPQLGDLQCIAFDADGKCTQVATAIGDINVKPASFVSRIMSLFLGLAGGIAVLLIIAAGYSLITSRNNPQAVQDARDRFMAAIVGLLFVIFSLVILEVIGVDILQIPGFGR